MLVVDAHQDLAWNMLTYGRDYTRSATETRQLEAGTIVINAKEDTLLGWPEFQAGNICTVFATLFATPQHRKSGEWDFVVYTDSQQAKYWHCKQIELYQRLAEEHSDKFRLLLRKTDLQAVLSAWKGRVAGAQDAPATVVGLAILMEGAEAVRQPAELEEWWQRGVRLIGPAWAGTRFCGGTREPGGLTNEGRALLEGMASLGFVLDLSHMDEKAALEALEIYPGRVVATHSNLSSLLKGSDSNRHLNERVLKGLIERQGIIGVVPFNQFLLVGWKQGDPRHLVSLHHLVAHIDVICQAAGNAWHAGLGTDFDGGFGWQSTPVEINTIRDLQKIVSLLVEKGYTQADIAAIMGQNWLGLLQSILPDSL